MTKLLGLTMLLIGASGLAFAVPAPEIGPASGASAVVLLSGALLVVQGRRKAGKK